MMFFAIIVRIKIKDNISRILPAITYFVLNALILNYSLQVLKTNLENEETNYDEVNFSHNE